MILLSMVNAFSKTVIQQHVNKTCLNNCLFFCCIFLICLLLLFSCNNGSDTIKIINQSDAAVANRFTLKETGEKAFPLDSVTAYYTNCLGVVRHHNRRIFYLLNDINNAVYRYSYDSGKLIDIVSLDSIVALYGKVSGVLPDSDSLILVHAKSKRISITDWRGHLLQSWRITFNRFSCDNFTGSTINPLIKKGNFVYLSSHYGPFGYEPQKEFVNYLILEINLKSKKQVGYFKYPDIYKQGLWGGYMTTNYMTYNPETDRFVHSFPICHNVYVHHLSGQAAEYYAGSRYISEITSIKKEKLFDRQERYKYYLTTPSYSSIYYDPYRKVYYRFALQAISKEDVLKNDPGLSRIKHASIIILDREFNKIGETLLPRFSYTEYMVFITKEGVHIGKWSKSKNDENHLYFGVFELSK